MKKFMMGIVAMLMIIAAGVLVPINGASVYQRLTAPSPNDTFSVGEIKRVGELSVLSVKYSENQTIDNANDFISKVPFGKSKVVVNITGTIKIGFDFRDLKIKQSENNFAVSMPEMKVLSNERKDFTIVSDQNGLFSNISHEKLMKAINKKFDKNEYADKVLKENTASAQQSAEALIKAQIQGFDPKANVTFTTGK
ncbi:hypothetical protein C6P08_04850 [Weissella confusa]|uniref:DUF4230 domain-containing protein n=1 Tax=Weissella confusa TaxID=1583 RepID=UPI0010924AAB|nr:DUF4230 domain-containing protein [Weissella confusa]MBJ7694787.1 DUF4230 domain-containing protein [Weissella confusa]QBZ04546.1 hypothetical protein C6P08_04850 [Weissella confusa]